MIAPRAALLAAVVGVLAAAPAAHGADWTLPPADVSGSAPQRVAVTGLPGGGAVEVYDTAGGGVLARAEAGDGTWSAPVTVARGEVFQGSDDSSKRQPGGVGTDAAGDVVATWFDGTTLRTAVRLPNGAWSSPADAVAQPDPAGGSWGTMQDLHLAVDSGGEAVAAWATSSPAGEGLVRVARRQADGTWTAPETLHTPQFSYSSTVTDLIQGPAVGLDDQGRATLVWAGDDGVYTGSPVWGHGIRYGLWELDGTIAGGFGGAPTQISGTCPQQVNGTTYSRPDGYLFGDPAVAVAPDGARAVGYALQVSGDCAPTDPDVVRVSDAAAGEAFGVGTDVLATHGQSIGTLALARNAAGDEGAAFVAGASGPTYFASRHPGAGWHLGTAAEGPGSGGPSPAVGVDRFGLVSALWAKQVYTPDGYVGGLFAATDPGDGTWGSPVQLSDDGRAARFLTLAADGPGAWTALWEGDVPDNGPLLASWRAPAVLPPVADPAAPPAINPPAAQVGVDESVTPGSWTQGVPDTYTYRWERCPAGGGACTTVQDGAEPTYRPTAADLGSRLRATVTAGNRAGDATATSAPTDPVAPAATPDALAPTVGVQVLVGGTWSDWLARSGDLHVPAGTALSRTWSCHDEDGGSGIGRCTGTDRAADGTIERQSEDGHSGMSWVPTAGTHTFTVEAADVAGNTTTRQVRYVVDPVPSPTSGGGAQRHGQSTTIAHELPPALPAAGLLGGGASTTIGVTQPGSVIVQGSGVIAAGGANVIAAGGGNVIAAGGANVIAAGGGNVIAAGGANVIAAGGGNVIAAGGGNVIAAGGGNVIAAGGANVIAAGGGNVIAAGGGNVIAAGGGNVFAPGAAGLLAPSWSAHPLPSATTSRAKTSREGLLFAGGHVFTAAGKAKIRLKLTALGKKVVAAYARRAKALRKRHRRVAPLTISVTTIVGPVVPGQGDAGYSVKRVQLRP